MVDRRGCREITCTNESRSARHSRLNNLCLVQYRLLIPSLETESSPEQVSHLVNSVIQEDILCTLARSIYLLPFEARKDAQAIFSYVLRFKPSNTTSPDPPALAHIVDARPEVVIELCRGYDHRESAMPCGIVLREALKHDAIAAIILYDQPSGNGRTARIEDIDFERQQSGEGMFWKFFDWIDKGAFEVSTDAFTTFRVMYSNIRDTSGSRSWHNITNTQIGNSH